MKRNYITLSYLLLTCFSINWLSCTKDKTPEIDMANMCLDIEVSYDLNIKPILDKSCAVGGCHVNGGDGPGVYTSYDNITPYIEDGSFQKTTIEQKDDPNIGMPPDWSNNGAPKDLTDSELELISCWLENGYPK